MMSFIDSQRAEGYAVESICRVLREQDCEIASRTYRAWHRGVPAARTVTDAQVMNAVHDTAWTVEGNGRRRLTPEGCMGGGR